MAFGRKPVTSPPSNGRSGGGRDPGSQQTQRTLRPSLAPELRLQLYSRCVATVAAPQSRIIMGKVHICASPACPCYECSNCKRKMTQKSKFVTHQRHGVCAGLLTPEQKARDLAGRLAKEQGTTASTPPPTPPTTPPPTAAPTSAPPSE